MRSYTEGEYRYKKIKALQDNIELAGLRATITGVVSFVLIVVLSMQWIGFFSFLKWKTNMSFCLTQYTYSECTEQHGKR